MGRRYSIATRVAPEEFATIQLEFLALLQEARALHEEAQALSAADADELDRRSLLARQASVCCVQAATVCVRLSLCGTPVRST